MGRLDYVDRDNRKVFEDALLRAMDTMAGQAKDNTTKMLADLMKSAVLKPYQEAYYQELAQGSVHKDAVKDNEIGAVKQ